MQSVTFRGADNFRLVHNGCTIEGYFLDGYLWITGLPTRCPAWPNLSLSDKMAQIWGCL